MSRKTRRAAGSRGPRPKFTQKASLRNFHHLVLTDVKTGEVVQEGWAHNTILNQGFERLVDGHWVGNVSRSVARMLFGSDAGNGWAGFTFVGGDGGSLLPVAATNTALGDFIDYKVNSYYASDYDMATLTAWHTRLATWTDLEIPSVDIKEVGLGVGSETTGLATRALVEDAEGNPITIEKGADQALSIYSTVFIELSHAYGTNFAYVEGASPAGDTGNALLRWVADNGQPYTNCLNVHLGRNADSVASADGAVKTGIYRYSVPAGEWTRNGAAKKIECTARIPLSEGNHGDGIWEVGLEMYARGFERNDFGSSTVTSRPSIFRSLMPLTGVWTGATITDEGLGDGDGAETTFGPTTWVPIKAGSYTVKVDGVTQTETTDYTINTTTGVVTFESGSVPGAGLPVTITYDIDQIPKDDEHILAVDFEIVFADGNA